MSAANEIEQEFFDAYAQYGGAAPTIQTIDGLRYINSPSGQSWRGSVDVPTGQLGACRLSWINAANGYRYVGGEVPEHLTAAVVGYLSERGYRGSAKATSGGMVGVVGKKEWQS